MILDQKDQIDKTLLLKTIIAAVFKISLSIFYKIKALVVTIKSQ